VARRADPERIFIAWRIAVRNSLTGNGMSLEDAERWCDEWEVEAAMRDVPRDPDYWTVGSAWIAEHRAARRRYLA
jgi:hypothetical protein